MRRKKISQAIFNLLDNALKYSDPKGTISLTLEKRGRYVHLDVFNTTLAISAENLKNLFDRFYRADPSRNSQIGGHGIGLSSVQAVVLAYKGEGQRLQSGRTLPGHLCCISSVRVPQIFIYQNILKFLSTIEQVMDK